MGGPVPAVGPNPAGGVRNPVLVGGSSPGGPAIEPHVVVVVVGERIGLEVGWNRVVELDFLGSPEIGWPSIASLWMDDLATA